MPDEPTHWLIVGCGDTGQRVARRLLARGDRVTAVVRSAESAAALTRSGIAAQAIDLDSSPPPSDRYDGLIHLAPPPRDGNNDPRLARALDAASEATKRLLYVSTTGVYGPCDGAWVDEDRPCNPETYRARRRVAAEQRVAASGLCWHVLRAPGIYGPGRIPLQKLRDGDPVLRDTDSPWTNRIHVEDLASALLAVIDHAPANRVYNVSDGRPTRMAEQYRVLARLLGLSPPPEIEWAEAERDWSAMRLSFLRESRRVDNARLRRESGWAPDYPDLESGLSASLAQQKRD